MENQFAQARSRPETTVMALMAILVALGIALIYSATHKNESEWMRSLPWRQLIWAAIGAAIFYTVSFVPLRTVFDLSYVVYFLTLVFLVLVIFKGSAGGGAVRWFAVGSIRLQPAEFAKLGLLLALARYLSSRTLSFENLSTLVAPGFIVFIPMALVLKQPDLSTSLVFGAMLVPMLFWSGLTVLEIFFLVSPVLSLLVAFNTFLWAAFFILLFFLLVKFSRNIPLIAAFLSVNFFIGIVLPLLWGRLADYQKNRILSFVDPTLDPFGTGYQVIQSQVAIGSGKIVGKGFLKGTQTSLSFLPEQHTDFIFSVLGEQFGLLGCILVIALFSALVIRLFFLAGEIHNRFLSLIIIGFASELAFHTATNIAMTIGIMPVTGLPLPFLSYGGSFLIACMTLMGFAVFSRKLQEER